MEPTEIYAQVNKRYGSIEKTRDGKYEEKIAAAFGYTEEGLAGVPDGANLAVSCGNPFALAKLRECEVVLDLGSGAGFDVFMAAKAVGPFGKAIGVDMNKKMLDKANANKAKANASNVEFIEAPITSIPLLDNSIDCIISNCVINLVPENEKHLVFSEMYRLLKPGGRVAISDILARKPLTEDMKRDIALYVGCISGASQAGEYRAYLRSAGFRDFLITDSKYDLNVYNTAREDVSAEKPPACCIVERRLTCCESPASQSQYIDCKGNVTSGKTGSQSRIPTMLDFNEWAGSFKIYAVKEASKTVVQ